MNCCLIARLWLPILGLVALLGALGLSKATFSTPAAEPSAHDWPMLGGTIHRNMVNPVEKNLPLTWSVKEGARKNIKWAADLGMTSFGVPVIAGGKVFVGTNNDQPRNPKIKGDKGVLMCFRESDGQFLWQAVHDKLPTGQENDWPHQGVASSPVVDGNRLYYVSNRCEVICAGTEGKNGEVDAIWRLDMIKDLAVNPRFLAICSPLIIGDLLYVVTGNGVADLGGGKLAVPFPNSPSFLAINKSTGKIVWQSNLPGTKIIDGEWSNPVAAEVNGKMQVIFPGGDGWLYGLDAKTGGLIWKFDGNPKDAEPYKPGGKGQACFFLGNPVVYENKLYVGLGQEPENDGQGAGLFWCVDITRTGDVSPELVVNDKPVKTEPNKNSAKVWLVNGLKEKGGDRDYSFGRTISTPAVHDGLVYMTDMDGFLYCFDANTGTKYWEEDLKTGIWSSPYWVDGKIYLGTDDSEVQIFAHGKEKKLLGKVEVGAQVKAPVVAANGVLYVMTGKQLFAIGNNQK
jgi:outer membrane protein assembly factor BamB